MRLKQSLQYFVKANKLNKNVSLLVATEHLVKVVNDLQAFQNKIDGKLDELRESAMRTIRQFVKHTVVATGFEVAITERKKAENELRKMIDLAKNKGLQEMVDSAERALKKSQNLSDSKCDNLLNDELLFSTLNGQMQRDKMCAKLAVFSDSIQRSFSSF